MRRAALGLVLLLAAPALAAEPLAVLDLRSGMSRGEIEALYPEMVFEEVPYLDPRVGDAYRYIYGGLAILRIEGSGLVQRGPLQASLEVTLTGDRALYRAGGRIAEEGVSCADALARLRERHGTPALGGEVDYTLWREGEVLYATQLEFRCLDATRGIYRLDLYDPFRERLFHKSLAKRLQPALEATFQVLR